MEINVICPQLLVTKLWLVYTSFSVNIENPVLNYSFNSNFYFKKMEAESEKNLASDLMHGEKHDHSLVSLLLSYCPLN